MKTAYATAIITSLAMGLVNAQDCTMPQDGAGTVEFAGINIAGFGFGCTRDGSCDFSKMRPPLLSLGGADGNGQMRHFVNEDGLNIFRLPVGWQYLVNNNLGGALNAFNTAKYDQLVQGCLQAGASCIIDIHNYARWNGKMIGQGGPTDAQFASLWTQLAVKYRSSDRIIFGLMNEPHDFTDIARWQQSVQAAVNAIRNTGATNLILLPGNSFSSALNFVSGGSAAALAKVSNPDGSKTGLIFDVHQYSDSDRSGTHTECVSNRISDAFGPLAQWLRCNGRQALVSEMGGGNTASCIQDICDQIQFLNDNSDVYLGYLGWAAGSFDKTYELVLTPTFTNGGWVDTPLVTSCFKR